jgi:integrase
MTMPSIDALMRITWGDLICDPASPAFLTQRVASSTEECPQGSTVADNIWVFPAEICTKLSLRDRVIDFNIPAGSGTLTDPQHEDLLLWTKRYMLALMSSPNRNILHLASIRGEWYFVKAFVKFVGSFLPKADASPLSVMTQTRATQFVEKFSANWDAKNSFYRLELFLKRIQRFASEGRTGHVLSDAAYRAMLLATHNRSKHAFAHWSQQNPDDKLEVESAAYTPLPDDYCRASLEIAAFFRENLAEHLVAHAMKHKEMFEKNAQADFEKWAKSYEWPVKELPFPHEYAFPPSNWRQTSHLISMLQTANAHEVLLFTGARTSEFLQMKPDCVSVRSAGETELHSIRFKNSAALTGSAVHWPIPKCVAAAVGMQIRLATALGVSDAVWLAPRSLAGPLKDNIVSMLSRFASAHGLDASNGRAATVNVQRFRPTIARLVMLAQGTNPRLVKRVLGHRYMSTTISYLEMNPFIQEELKLNRLNHSDAAPGETLAATEVDLTPSVLTDLLRVVENDGRKLHAVGPGVFVTADRADESEVEVLDADETVAFLVDSMTQKAVHRSAVLYDWFASETADIVSRSLVGYQPPTPRHEAIYRRIVGGMT